jgi:signal peptidase I
VFANEALPGQTHAVTGIPAMPAMRDFEPKRVPEGQYFMMGDNRDDSFDSRYWGTVDRKQIIGRATAVVLSLDKSNYWLPRWQRSFTSLRTESQATRTPSF